MIVALYFFLHEFLTRDFTEPSPLGEHCPRCSMKPTTNKTAENQYIFPMELYNTTPCSIYNEHCLKHDKHTVY